MSLINQMLRDLDARQADGDDRVLPGQAVALPAHTGLPRTKILFWGLLCGGLALSVVVGGGWLPSSPLPAVAPSHPAAVLPAESKPDVSVGGLAAPVEPLSTTPVLSVAVQERASSGAGMERPAPESPQPVSSPVLPVSADSKPAVRSLPASNVFPAGATNAIQLKLDELLTFNVRARGGEKESAKVGGGSPEQSSVAGRVVRLDGSEKPAQWENQGKLLTEAGTPRIEKIDRHEPGAGFYQSGLEAIKQGRLKDAVEQLQLALQENPKLVMARQTLLKVYVDQRDWDEAQVLLKEGLALMPDQSGWAMGLARIQVERGQSEQAWETLQKYDAVGGRNADYQGFAGVLLQHMKKPHEAAERYRLALKFRPREGRWWYALGTALEEDGQAAEALEVYRRAFALGGLTPSMAESIEKKLR